MKPRIEVSPWLYIFLAFAVLILPVKLLFSAIAAAALHELFHIWALSRCKVSVSLMQIGIGGAEIHTGNMSWAQEVFCAAAGPVGSFLLLSVSEWFPLLSLFGFVQGAFNLLPVYPMDGGRILCAVLDRMSPIHGRIIAQWTGRCVICLMTALLLCVLSAETGILVLIFLFGRTLIRKKSCKDALLQVQ